VLCLKTPSVSFREVEAAVVLCCVVVDDDEMSRGTVGGGRTCEILLRGEVTGHGNGYLINKNYYY
jgi:hypothetical protein